MRCGEHGVERERLMLHLLVYLVVRLLMHLIVLLLEVELMMV